MGTLIKLNAAVAASVFGTGASLWLGGLTPVIFWLGLLVCSTAVPLLVIDHLRRMADGTGP